MTLESSAPGNFPPEASIDPVSQRTTTNSLVDEPADVIKVVRADTEAEGRLVAGFVPLTPDDPVALAAQQTFNGLIREKRGGFKAFLHSAISPEDVVTKAIGYGRTQSSNLDVEELRSLFRRVFSHMKSTHGELPRG